MRPVIRAGRANEGSARDEEWHVGPIRSRCRPGSVTTRSRASSVSDRRRKWGYMIVETRRNEGLPVQAIEVVDHGKDVIVANYLRIE